MADSNVAITEGSGKNIDTRTNAGGDHRQVIVVGDPSVTDAVAEVVSADPGPTSSAYGQVVRLAGSAQVQLAGSSGTIGVHLTGTTGTLRTKLDEDSTLGGIRSSISIHLQSTAGTLRVGDIPGSLAVYFSPAEPTIKGITNTVGTYLSATAGTLRVKLDEDSTLGGIRNSMSVHLASTGGTLWVKTDPDATLGGIRNSLSVYLSATAGTINVKTDPSSVLAGIASSISTYISGTAGSLGVRVGQVDGSVAVYFSRSKPIVLADNQHTAGIFTVTGSTSGGTTSGVTLVAPSANYNFKVFAYSLQTTSVVSEAWRFTNGAGSETELWRPLVTPNSSTSETRGANLAVQPPGYLFATGTSTTLALKSSSGSLVHYSVSYIKESA